MRILFHINEFLIERNKEIPVDVADKIYNYHIIPMLNIRHKLGFPIYPSKRSSYRSKEWELSHGRLGGSQHCFVDKGATDWTCSNFKQNKSLFLSELIKHSEYTRIAIYDTFIHCDYKETPNEERQLFETVIKGDKTVWKFKNII